MSMKPILSILFAASCGLPAAQMPNVLFIAVDDLKPMLGCYGDTVIKTPNIDRLASRGTTFLNAYCQQAICGPTRASLLTGLRPDSTGIYDLQTKLRALHPDVITLPQYFKQSGYESVGIGKIFDPRNVEGEVRDDPKSWSRPYTKQIENADSRLGFLKPDFVKRVDVVVNEKGLEQSDLEAITKAVGGMPTEEIDQDVPDGAYQDGALAKRAIELVGELSKGEKPFFLAVGFYKPHLPFVAPKKYADMYSMDDIRLAKFRKMPEGAPSLHYQPSWELKNGSYAGFANFQGKVTDDLERNLVHGYMACVSYLDAQVGRLLDSLEANGLSDNTIVVLWGDHGWHLGDHGMWCKHTNYEQATRSPLIISRPQNGPRGAKSASPVEFVDVFPTLCDLAGLPKPPALEGCSLVPILENPEVKVKEVAVSQYPRGHGKDELMGYAFRDKRYRYIEWVPKGKPGGQPVATELYDYQTDPLETKNLATDPERAEALANMRGIAKNFHLKNRVSASSSGEYPVTR